MKKSLKSQITMLMIVGIVIFIIVGLFLYLSKTSVKKQSQQNIKTAQETAFEAQPIKDFVNKCLDKLGKDAIVLLGKQGGYIYKSQGGTLIDYPASDEGLFYLRYGNFNVAYNIRPQAFSTAQYSPQAPDYPWTSFPYPDAASNEKVFDGVFGADSMPPLKSFEGPNSIQSQMESFIDSNIGSCLDFGIFTEQGFEIEMNSSKTSVSIGVSDVSIRSKIPLTIKNPAADETTKIEEFSVNVNVRLSDIYFFVKTLVEKDITNIKFNISDVANGNSLLSVRSVNNVFSGDDIIKITDGQSLVDGKPYEYIFGRRNRLPALYYIKDSEVEFAQDYEIKLADLLQGSELKADDPDEDDYVFTTTPALPREMNAPEIPFRIEVNDGELSDYQIIVAKRI